MASSSPFQQLAQVRLSHLLKARRDREVVMLEHSSSVADALRILSRRRILSAPLICAPGLEDLDQPDAPSGPVLLGWVGVDDLLSAFLRDLRSKVPTLPTSMLALMALIEKEGPAFTEKMLVSVAGGEEDRGLVFSADAETTLIQTIRDVFLATRSNGRVNHRVAIFDARGEITHIVSQLDVVRFLTEHPELLGGLAERSVEELGLLSNKSPVCTFSADRPTLLALEEMLNVGLSGAPVVTSNGKVIANLSISDLRCIQPSHLGVLALPVAEFLALLHNTAYAGYCQTTAAPQNAAHPFFARSSSNASNTSGNELPGSPARSPARTSSGVGGKSADSAGVSPGNAGGNNDDVKFVAVHRGSAIREVLQTMSEQHVHRVYVLNEEPGLELPLYSEVLGVITPTDVLRLVATAAAAAEDGGGAKKIHV